MDALIDESGAWWPVTSGPFLTRLKGVTDGSAGSIARATGDLGYSRLRLEGDAVRLTICQEALSWAALQRIVQFLVHHPWRRLLIEHCPEKGRAGDLNHEIYGELEDAVVRLRALGAGVRRPSFESQDLSLARLGQGDRASLRALYRLWRSRRGDLPDDLVAWLGHHGLWRRGVLAHATRGHILVEFVGAGFKSYDACWTLAAVGRDLENQPDPDYGARASRAYHEVASICEPRLERVDAVIAVPGRTAHQSRYERLLLPWRAGGDVFVSGVSMLRMHFALESRPKATA